MLDMGFLPDIRRVLKHLPAAQPDAVLLAPPCRRRSWRSRARCCATPPDQPRAHSPRPPSGITQAVYPVPQDVKSSLLLELLERGEMKTRWSSRAPSIAPTGWPTSSCAQHRLRAHPRQPQPGPAHGGPRRLQERPVSRPGGHRHRRARDRRRGVESRHQLRRARRTRGLHPPRRAHGAGGDDGRRLHLRVAGGGRRPQGHRARGGQAAASRDPRRLRLRAKGRGEARGAPRPAHRGDSRPQGRRSRAREGQCRAAGPASGRPGPADGGGSRSAWSPGSALAVVARPARRLPPLRASPRARGRGGPPAPLRHSPHGPGSRALMARANLRPAPTRLPLRRYAALLRREGSRASPTARGSIRSPR